MDSLVSGSIPNLVNGVSQQPDALRLSSQFEIQNNCYSSVVEGLTDRPPTRHIKKIISGTISDAFTHLINRDVAERYEVILTDGSIRVFDLAGDEKSVMTEDETYTILSGATAVVAGEAFKIYPAVGETAVDFNVSGTFVGQIKLQMSTNGLAWSDVAIRTTPGTNPNIAIGPNIHLRASISSYTSGSINASVTYQTLRYIGHATPSTSFRAITIADHSFIVNKQVVTRMKTTLTADRGAEAMLFVKVGNYGSTYKVIVDGVERASYTTSNSVVTDIATDQIATQLTTQLTVNLGSGSWTIIRSGSSIYLQRIDKLAFDIRTTDSQDGRSLSAIKSTVQRVSDLPAKAFQGFVVKVVGEPNSNADDYYIKFVTDSPGNTSGEGTWVETVAMNIPYQIDASTMPHILVRNANGSFTFKVAVWSERTAGDTTSAPDPSFIGATINDLFFFNGRLCVLSDDNVLGSEISEFFNFFPTTATTLVESDPIDASASDTKVSILRHAVPFNEQVVLFSDQTQFVMRGDTGGILSQKTISINPTTEFENSLTASPIGVGNLLYFATPKDIFNGMREFFVDTNRNAVHDAVDVTGHIPKYIPASIFKLTANTLENLIVAQTTGDAPAVYVYKFFWADQTKLQSAWFRWDFGDSPGPTKVLSADFIETSLYLLIQRSDGVYFESMALTPGRSDVGQSYTTHIDRRCIETQCPSRVFNAIMNQTTFTLPYTLDGGAMVVTRSVNPGTVLPVLSQLGATVVVQGNHTTTLVYIGQRYNRRARMSRIFLRESSRTQPGSQNVLVTGRLQLRNLALLYSDTGYFKVTITPEHRTPSVYEFTGRILGDGGNLIGTPSISSGRFITPILSKNDRVTIDIHNDSHLPFKLTGAEWTGLYTNHTARV